MAPFMFILAVVALLYGWSGYRGLEETHGGTSILPFVFEVGLPAFIAAGCLWQGIVYVRSKPDAA